MTEQANPVAEGLVIDDMEAAEFKVNRKVFTDLEIFKLERARVFDKCWLYVGHDSEIPENGSFVARKVGGRPVIFVRDVEGQVRVMFDACTHRGNTVCQERQGKTERFLCAYHGWMFNTKGELRVVPDPAAYGDKLNREKLALGAPPRIDNYRGMYFMSMDPDIVDLRTYLNGATEYIDMILDLSESEPVIAGLQSYGIQANWKLLQENSADVYHAIYTHMRFFKNFLTDVGKDISQWREAWNDEGDSNVLTFDYGHSVIDTPAGPIPGLVERPEVYEKLRANLTAQHGAERAALLLGRSQNLLIFPNLVMISLWRTVRTFYPVAPNKIECHGWAIAGKDDSPELREARFQNFNVFLGPAGFGTPDDIEVLENCQRGFEATEMAWTDLSRGMGRKGGAVANDEIQMRAFWRRWYSLMNPNYKPQVERSSTQSAMAAE